MKRSLCALLVVGAVASGGGTALAQAAPGNGPVSREEFDKVMKELTDLRQEVTSL